MKFFIKRHILILLVACCFTTQAVAQERYADVFEVVSAFRNDLYRMGETTGGGEIEWQSLEISATAELISVLDNWQAEDPVVNERGRTPLHEAAGHGFYFLLEQLIEHENFRGLINHKDEDGLTAFALAHLAQSETLIACHPELENPFVLVPYLVKYPYYEFRRPYPRVHALLINAGADTSLETAKKFWLDACSQPDSTIRKDVENTDNLYSTLKAASLFVQQRMKADEVAERAERLREINQLMPASKRRSAKEIRALIDKMYREEGLEPPSR